jgi:hypothetical protein
LNSISFIPGESITLEEARRTARQDFGVDLQEGRYGDAPAVHYYRDMSGPVKTVNFKRETLNGSAINEIGIFFDVPY